MGPFAIRLSERGADSTFQGMHRRAKRVLSNQNVFYTARTPVLADADGRVVHHLFRMDLDARKADQNDHWGNRVLLRGGRKPTNSCLSCYGIAAVVMFSGLFVLLISLLRAL